MEERSWAYLKDKENNIFNIKMKKDIVYDKINVKKEKQPKG